MLAYGGKYGKEWNDKNRRWKSEKNKGTSDEGDGKKVKG
jgi:hypothetical protein